jgi:hypothetical protein
VRERERAREREREREMTRMGRGGMLVGHVVAAAWLGLLDYTAGGSLFVLTIMSAILTIMGASLCGRIWSSASAREFRLVSLGMRLPFQLRVKIEGEEPLARTPSRWLLSLPLSLLEPETVTSRIPNSRPLLSYHSAIVGACGLGVISTVAAAMLPEWIIRCSF